MNWPDISISIIASNAIVLSLLWLVRNLIVTRLTHSVRHEYDSKIEKLKSSLRQNEESFKAKLETNFQEIDALRNNALSNITKNQRALNERRIIAVEQIWQEVDNLAPAKSVAVIMSKIDIDEIEKSVGQHTTKAKKFMADLSKIAGGFEIKDIPKNKASLTRPFVSPLAWSLYLAYSAIIYRSCLQYELLKNGVGTQYLESKNITALIEAVLPHQKITIDKYGLNIGALFLEELETLLLEELDSILEGKKYDKENIDRADLIIKEVNKVRAEHKSNKLD